MNEQIINWDEVPELLSNDGFYKLCHISKSTARHLLRSGKVPCEFSGKKTRCYQIRKEDVRKYLSERAVFPELYSAPQGWYGCHYHATVQKELPEETHEEMLTYYRKLLAGYRDVLSVAEISKLTGYGTTAINNWCAGGNLRHFTKGRKNMIPKVFLIEYFCSLPFRSITRKTPWHVKTISHRGQVADTSGFHGAQRLHAISRAGNPAQKAFTGGSADTGRAKPDAIRAEAESEGAYPLQAGRASELLSLHLIAFKAWEKRIKSY